MDVKPELVIQGLARTIADQAVRIAALEALLTAEQEKGQEPAPTVEM